MIVCQVMCSVLVSCAAVGGFPHARHVGARAAAGGGAAPRALAGGGAAPRRGRGRLREPRARAG